MVFVITRLLQLVSYLHIFVSLKLMTCSQCLAMSGEYVTICEHDLIKQM